MEAEFNKKNMENVINNEKELHRKFVILGNNRRKLTNELLALLPEIYEKGIYKKYAATIVEYAGKFGGLSKGVVKKRLGLEKYLKDKPNLKEAIKTEGVHKVALIAKLATRETENAWVDRVKNMSKAGLFELAKEVREKAEDGKCKKSFSGAADCTNLGFCKAAPQKVKIEIEGELLFMFLKMKKKYGNNLSNNEVMKRILEEASEQNIIPPSTEQKVEVFPGKKVSRYVKVKIKKQTLSSTNGKCSYPSCEKPSENLHHPERFAESRNHEFMHNGLVENEKNQSGDWRLNLDGKLSEVDGLYRGYRKLAMWN